MPPGENGVDSTACVSCASVCETDPVFTVVEGSVGEVIVEEVVGDISGMFDHRLSSLTLVDRFGEVSLVVLAGVLFVVVFSGIARCGEFSSRYPLINCIPIQRNM